MTLLIVATMMLLAVYSTLLLFFRRGFKHAGQGTGDKNVGISLLVPAHNEEECLPVLFESLDNQQYDRENWEILLINDRSTDSTPQLINDYAAQRPHVRVLHITKCASEVSPKKNALAQAIEQARHDIIVTTDADTKPGPNWIQSLARYYSGKQSADVVIGYASYSTSKPYTTLFHRLLALEYFSLASVALASVGLGYPSTSSGANLSYKKSLFKKVDGFGETMRYHSGDDDLLIHRFKELENPIMKYAVGPASVVSTNPPATFKQFVRQRIRFASKHLAYPKKVVILLAAVYLFHCFMLVTILLTPFFAAQLWASLTVILILKGLFDLTFLIPAQKLLESRNLLKFYPLAVIPHVFYVVLFPILGQIMPKKW